MLKEHGYYARSYTLAHICNEELSKIPMLVGVAMDLINGEDIDWKKLSRRLSNHIEKLNAMHAHDYFTSEIRADDSDVTAYDEAKKTTPKLNENKNNSLYAGIVNNKFKQPNDIFNEKKATTTLSEVYERLKYFESIESKTVGKLSNCKISLAYRKLRKN